MSQQAAQPSCQLPAATADGKASQGCLLWERPRTSISSQPSSSCSTAPRGQPAVHSRPSFSQLQSPGHLYGFAVGHHRVARRQAPSCACPRPSGSHRLCHVSWVWSLLLQAKQISPSSGGCNPGVRLRLPADSMRPSSSSWPQFLHLCAHKLLQACCARRETLRRQTARPSHHAGPAHVWRPHAEATSRHAADGLW